MILDPFIRKSGAGGLITLQDQRSYYFGTTINPAVLGTLDCTNADTVVIASMIYLNGDVTSVTDSDGDTYVKLNSIIYSRTYLSIWSAVGITKSSNKVITLTYTSGRTKNFHLACAYSGVDQVTPLYDYQAVSGDNPSVVVTPTAAADGIISMSGRWKGTPQPPVPTAAGQIELWSQAGSNFGASVCHELAPGIGAKAHSWSVAGGGYDATNACVIKAAI
tara:strand:+ start:18230 stop:18889 length:660 start_codon:yes stop_codon:yes gene_type:complete